MSNYQSHLDREWKAMGWPTGRKPGFFRHIWDLMRRIVGRQENGDGDPQVWLYQHMQKLLKVFSEEGHSGSSAPYAVALFRKLALFEPLGPLTGEDGEWNDISEYGGDTRWQNNRCSHVFKNTDGVAYDIQGKVFEDPNGNRWTGAESHVEVKFPYTPKTEVVKRAGADPQ